MSVRWYPCLLVLIFLLNSIRIQAQAQCQVDSNKLLIGDQRNMQISVQGATGSPDSVDFASWKDQSFAVVSQSPWTQTATGIQKSLMFTVFDTGYIILDPLPITFRKGDSKDTIYTNDLALEVYPVIVDSTGLAPLKDIIREPLNLRDLAIYLAGVFLILAAIGIYLWRQKRSQAGDQIEVVVRPAHEIALEELSHLKGKKLWQQGHIKEYQSELTYIIRKYLENRFDLRALESTTGEILFDIREYVEDMRSLEDLDQILNIADLIKFAKAKPSVDIHQEFMDKAESFVFQTKVESNISEDDDLDE